MAKIVTWRLYGVLLTIVIFGITGCVARNAVTKEEIEKQNKADAIVSGVLFEHELDSTASYNVRKNGFVVIKFDESVPSQKYTEVVNLLRENSNINGVMAEQSGREVCPLRR